MKIVLICKKYNDKYSIFNNKYRIFLRFMVLSKQ